MYLNISYNYKITDIGEPDWYKNVHKEIWVDHEYSRYGVEVEEEDAEDEGHELHDLRLHRIRRDRVHLRLQDHRHRHQDGQDVIGIQGRKVGDP